MRPSTMIEVLSAACDTRYINGPFPERGFIFIVAAPGNMKTTIIEAATQSRHDAILCSNINAAQWSKIKNDFISKRLTTIALPEFEAIYKRAKATALHTEAIVQAITAEGYMHGPGQDPRMPRIKARSLVLGGITVDCHERKYDEWTSCGFTRRGLWCLITVSNPDEIVKSIRTWQRIDFGRIYERPALQEIRMDIDEKYSQHLETKMKDQPGFYGPGYVLLKKIAAVLDWKYKKTKTPQRGRELLEEFSLSLRKEGAEITL